MVSCKVQDGAPARSKFSCSCSKLMAELGNLLLARIFSFSNALKASLKRTGCHSEIKTETALDSVAKSVP